MGLVSISLACLKVKDFMEVLLSGVLLPTLGLMFKGDGVTAALCLGRRDQMPTGDGSVVILNVSPT